MAYKIMRGYIILIIFYARRMQTLRHHHVMTGTAQLFKLYSPCNIGGNFTSKQ